MSPTPQITLLDAPAARVNPTGTMATGRAHCLSEMILEAVAGRKRVMSVGMICEKLGPPQRGSPYWRLGGRRPVFLEDTRRALDLLRKEGLAQFVGPKRTGGWSVRKREALPEALPAADATGSETPPDQ
jgi:hypothetical protein